jgi:hypothetical protein
MIGTAEASWHEEEWEESCSYKMGRKIFVYSRATKHVLIACHLIQLLMCSYASCWVVVILKGIISKIILKFYVLTFYESKLISWDARCACIATSK